MLHLGIFCFLLRGQTSQLDSVCCSLHDGFVDALVFVQCFFCGLRWLCLNDVIPCSPILFHSAVFESHTSLDVCGEDLLKLVQHDKTNRQLKMTKFEDDKINKTILSLVSTAFI